MDADLDILDKLIAEGQGFSWSNFCQPSDKYPGKYAGADGPEWIAWKARVVNTVFRLCTENSSATTLVNTGAAVSTRGNGPDKFEHAKATLLNALDLTRGALCDDSYGELKGPSAKHPSPKVSNRVFVVHGHDASLKTDVERFLHELGLEPVILHRQVDEGATLIEKFEKHADVGYAFILLTPDEIAFTIDQVSLPDDRRTSEKRARPNVIFEFGYFVGRLGRARVCCLHKAGVSIPSDLQGLIYKQINVSVDEQAYSIIKELKAAGYQMKI